MVLSQGVNQPKIRSLTIAKSEFLLHINKILEEPKFLRVPQLSASDSS
jgi:hypothetical protein